MLAVLAAIAPASAADGTKPKPRLTEPRLIFSSNRTGAFHVYTARPSSAGLGQLTFDKEACDPVPSPNGRHVLFERCGLPGLWVMNADGGAPAELAATGYDGSWHPDSGRIVFLDGQTRTIAIVNRDGAGRRLLPRQSDIPPTWSPDGSSVLYVRAGVLYVRREGADRAIALDAVGAAWSPDGRWIALTKVFGEQIDVIKPDGTARRRLTDVRRGPFGPALAWSPRGRYVAFADLAGIHVVEVATGRPRTLEQRAAASELAWSPSGRELAYVTYRQGAIRLLTLAGEARTVFPVRSGDEHRGVAWTRPPPGTRYRAPRPVTPLERIAGSELELRAPVDELAADGGAVAYEVCRALAVWRPGATNVTPIGAYGPNACRALQTESQFSIYSLALAGDRVAYMTTSGGNQISYTLQASSLAAPQPVAVAAGTRCCRGNPLDTVRMGHVLGHGARLVFSTWEAVGTPRRIVNETLWGLREPGFAGACPAGIPPSDVFTTRPGPCEQIAKSAEALTPLAVDAGRIVVRRGEGPLELLDTQGGLLRTIPLPAGEAIVAELAGDDLVVLVAGGLRHYSAGSGELRRTWPLPNLPSGGFCGVPCFIRPQLQLEDTAVGLAAYILNGELHLLRLTDGIDRAIGRRPQRSSRTRVSSTPSAWRATGPGESASSPPPSCRGDHHRRRGCTPLIRAGRNRWPTTPRASSRTSRMPVCSVRGE